MADLWWQPEPVIEEHGRFLVVRDDLVPGGSKMRFLPHLVEDAREVVFGGPFCGGAPYALSVWGERTGARITLFYAKRKQLHERQRKALLNGATIYQVPHGYMSNVQSKARRYAEQAGALFLPLGFDVPAASDPFIQQMRRARAMVGRVDQVWACTGSGMLARCLAHAFYPTPVHAVVVGLQSRNERQTYPDNVTMHSYPRPFGWAAKSAVPFPSCGNYDRKAWEFAQQRSSGKVLFWNVLG